MGFLFGDMQQRQQANQQQPQQNQYLQGNPATQPNANTGWMAPSNPTGTDVTRGYNNPAAGTGVANPIQNGTMLGQMSQPGQLAWNQGGSTSWLNQQLDAVKSTDDKSYWEKQASQDPKFMSGDESAKSWWLDAIRRGEGSELVKNGSLQVRGAGEADRGPGSMLGGMGGQNGMNMQQMMPMLMQMLQGSAQTKNMPQQVSNGSLFNTAGNSGGGNQMDISSFLNPAAAGSMMRKPTF